MPFDYSAAKLKGMDVGSFLSASHQGISEAWTNMLVKAHPNFFKCHPY